jgi:hypothetical protein
VRVAKPPLKNTSCLPSLDFIGRNCRIACWCYDVNDISRRDNWTLVVFAVSVVALAGEPTFNAKSRPKCVAKPRPYSRGLAKLALPDCEESPSESA